MADAATGTGAVKQGAAREGVRRRAIVSWCFYDWANSPYVAVIITFIIAAYYTGAVAPDAETGTATWGFMMGASALVVAVVDWISLASLACSSGSWLNSAAADSPSSCASRPSGTTPFTAR